MENEPLTPNAMIPTRRHQQWLGRTEATVLDRNSMRRVKRGYNSKRPMDSLRYSWEYNMGVAIRQSGDTLEQGLLNRGYNPYRTN